MPSSVAIIDINKLPSDIPVFPLTGALLLPEGQLPLNIFEPRYLAMVDAALSAGRWLGMVQPRDTRDQTVADTHPMFDTGCLGRITSFSENDDGMYSITLTGTCRFTIKSELEMVDGFRRIIPDFHKYTEDLQPSLLGAGERDALMSALKQYFEGRGYDADWPALEQTPDSVLVATMAMACPFAPAEKQALLEAPDLSVQTQNLITILDIASHDGAPSNGQHRH
jgi:uncharacterized protein